MRFNPFSIFLMFCFMNLCTSFGQHYRHFILTNKIDCKSQDLKIELKLNLIQRQLILIENGERKNQFSNVAYHFNEYTSGPNYITIEVYNQLLGHLAQFKINTDNIFYGSFDYFMYAFYFQNSQYENQIIFTDCEFID